MIDNLFFEIQKTISEISFIEISSFNTTNALKYFTEIPKQLFTFYR